jgi:hypothetical protein
MCWTEQVIYTCVVLYFQLISDKIKLLTRIFNEYRKKFGTITSITCVPDARCPVIRFIVFDAVKGRVLITFNYNEYFRSSEVASQF